MSNIETATKYISQGLSVIPIGADKKPLIAWKAFQGKLMDEKQIAKNFANGSGLAIICGAVSKNLEVVDVDCKYDLTGTLFANLKTRIGPEIFDKLVVATTPNKGYHLIYRCEKIEGNKKLAERQATDEEKSSGNKVMVLLETRGEGGYIAAAPTSGYAFIQKHLHQIPEITQEERDRIHSCAKEFNQNFKEQQIVSHTTPADGELGPLEDYNNKGDVLGLLVKHGWKIVHDDSEQVLLRRPGKNDGHSATYSRSKKWFCVFSTSTEFDSLKAYLPYAVYAVLECKGDFSEAARQLRSDGYGGDRQPRQKRHDKIRANVKEYLSYTDEDYKYLTDARSGLLPMGLTTGIPMLDIHFRFKRGNLVIVNGHDNVGKTLAILMLAVLSARNHSWKWIIYAGENRSGYIKRKIIELYLCKPVTKLTDAELNSAYQWVNEHFILIANNDMYTYKDMLAIAETLMEEKKYDAMLIDPYNSLSIEMDSFSKLSTHDYHYVATSEIRLFCKKFDCSVYINCHAVTEALRKTFSKGHEFEGYPMPPSKADTEGGGKFANRADDFLTIHRLVQHESLWSITEIHVRKIKETETGGRQTPMDSPVKLKIIHGNCGFEDENGYNPISMSHTPTAIQYIPPNPKAERISETKPIEEIDGKDQMPF